LRESLATIAQSDAQLLAIDPHEVWSAKMLLKNTGFSTDDLHYPLLMDPSITVSATYGVAFQMQIHVELSNRPATFIIDKQGIIRYARRALTYNDRPTVRQVIAELNKLN
jgi:peroxiredoxin